MFDTPASARLQFELEIPDEEAAERWLVAHRWPNGVECSFCGSKEGAWLKNRPRWWSCRVCKGQTSARSRSPLHGTRMPLRDWVYTIWRMTVWEAPSARQLRRELQWASYEAVWSMMQKIRATMLDSGAELLAGPEVILTVGRFGAGRPATGDPPVKTPFLVAIAVELQVKPLALGRRKVLATDIATSRDRTALEEAVCERLVEPTSTAQFPDRREEHVDYGDWLRHFQVTQRERMSLAAWIRARYRQVSRRYFPNYAAHWLFATRTDPPGRSPLDPSPSARSPTGAGPPDASPPRPNRAADRRCSRHT